MLLTRIVTFILLKCILSEGINVTVEYDNDNTCGSMVRIECGTEGYGIVFQLIYPNSTKTVAIAECQFGPRAYSQLMSGTFIGTYNVTMTTSTCILIILHLTTEQCGTYVCALMYNDTENVSRGITCEEAQTDGESTSIIAVVSSVAVCVVCFILVIGFCIHCQRKRSRHTPDAQPVENADELTACIRNGPAFDDESSVTDPTTSLDNKRHSRVFEQPMSTGNKYDGVSADGKTNAVIDLPIETTIQIPNKCEPKDGYGDFNNLSENGAELFSGHKLHGRKIDSEYVSDQVENKSVGNNSRGNHSHVENTYMTGEGQVESDHNKLNAPYGGHVDDGTSALVVTHNNTAENEPLNNTVENEPMNNTTSDPKSVVVSEDLLELTLYDKAETQICTKTDDISSAEKKRRKMTMNTRKDLTNIPKGIVSGDNVP